MIKVSKREYIAIHVWLYKKFGSASQCSLKIADTCSTSYEWALLVGKSHEKARENYIEACHNCHRKYDAMFNNNGHVDKTLDTKPKLIKPTKEQRELMALHLENPSEYNQVKIMRQLNLFGHNDFYRLFYRCQLAEK